MEEQGKKTHKKTYKHEYDPNNPLDGLAQSLETQLGETLAERSVIDTRMIEDLHNYHGRYTHDELQRLKDNERSMTFVNITRTKTDAAEAQMVDLLFPAVDKNWGIKPTPVPEVDKKMSDETPYQMNGTEYQDAQTGETIKVKDVARRERELAAEAAHEMEREIDDQLKESRYGEKSRKAIHDGCVLGTGIVKGPVVSGVPKRVFKEVEDENGEKSFRALMEINFRPGTEVVRPWDFYPDMSGADVGECEFVYERRYMTRKQVRNLIFRKGFPTDQVRKVLEMQPRETQHHSGEVDDIRRLAGSYDTLNDTRYEVWEYHGPIPKEVLLQLKLVDEKAAEDPLQEKTGVVIYCGGVVLSVRLHLIDYEQALPYQVWNWVQDDTSIFGFGVPRLMNHQQAMMNTAIRAMLDNTSITAGPQIVINRNALTPLDGKWDIRPFKIWEAKRSTATGEAFQQFEFNNHQQALTNIYSLARQMTDEVTGIPMLSQGEQGQSTPVLGGMSMLMNAANTVRRNQVKAWDDRVTTPLIRSFYAFNMEHSEKEEIKGDYQIVARGVSELLARENLSNAIMNLMNVAGGNQMFAQLLAPKSRKILEEWMKANQLPLDLLPSEAEAEEYRKQIEESEAQKQDPAVVSAQTQLEVEQMRAQTQEKKLQADMQKEENERQFEAQQRDLDRRVKLEQVSAEMTKIQQQGQIEVMKLANNRQINADKLKTELNKVSAQLDATMKRFNTEVMLKGIAGPEGNYGLETGKN